jgi:hypothetical protein
MRTKEQLQESIAILKERLAKPVQTVSEVLQEQGFHANIHTAKWLVRHARLDRRRDKERLKLLRAELKSLKK